LRPFSSFRLCVGKADGELVHKLPAYPSTPCFFAFRLCRSSSFSHHGPQRGALLRLSQACLFIGTFCWWECSASPSLYRNCCLVHPAFFPSIYPYTFLSCLVLLAY
jgi:hypothetical protein